MARSFSRRPCHWKDMFGALACVAACIELLASCGSPGTTSAAQVTIGPYAIGARTVTFVDGSRPTPADSYYAGSSSRVLVTAFFYPSQPGSLDVTAVPVARGRFPLVVFAHGFTAEPQSYKLLLGQLASAGFVVVAPRFPLSSRRAPGKPVITDISNQPGDMTYVINQVLALNRDPTSWLHNAIDPARIGVAGHSLGAITTLGLVYSDCCGDPRIKAAASLAGATILIPGQYFTGSPVPLLIIHGNRDDTVLYSFGVGAYQRAKPPKFLVTVLGGNHISYLANNASERRVAFSLANFFSAYLGRSAFPGGAPAIKRLDQEASAPGFIIRQDLGAQGSRIATGQRSRLTYGVPVSPGWAIRAAAADPAS